MLDDQLRDVGHILGPEGRVTLNAPHRQPAHQRSADAPPPGSPAGPPAWRRVFLKTVTHRVIMPKSCIVNRIMEKYRKTDCASRSCSGNLRVIGSIIRAFYNQYKSFEIEENYNSDELAGY
eukprot:735971_1